MTASRQKPRWPATLPRSLRLLLALGLGLGFAASPVFAHRPYERFAGAFQRSDGTTVSIVRHRVDGIIGADPVSVQFRLPDGTPVAQTPHVFDAIVRRAPAALEVYQFQSVWIPVANRVDRFDGYTLADVTRERRLVSPLVHFASHWLAYLIAVLLGLFIVRVGCALRAKPERGGWIALRGVGTPLVALAAGIYVYDILVFEPVSPLLLGFGGLGLVRARRLLGRRLRRRLPDKAV